MIVDLKDSEKKLVGILDQMNSDENEEINNVQVKNISKLQK